MRQYDDTHWHSIIWRQGLNLREKIIYIYKGPGVSKKSLPHFKKLFQKKTIHFLSCEEVLKGTWVNDAALFVMPGGADIPYTKKLNGLGNTIIKQYVENGGIYLGICAGAYYAAKNIAFSKGTESEVTGDRELSFFQGTIEGPTLAPYHLETFEGARAAYVEWNLDRKTAFHSFYNGGGHFINPMQYPNTKVLAIYKDLPSQPVAAVECSVGKGKAILSGVHFEYDPSLLDDTDPYLKEIIPILKKYDSKRIAFSLVSLLF